MGYISVISSSTTAGSSQVASMTSAATADKKSQSGGKPDSLAQPVKETGGGAARESHGSTIPGFYALDLESVKGYLAQRPELCQHLGPKESQSEWQVCPPPPSSPLHLLVTLPHSIPLRFTALSPACTFIPDLHLTLPDPSTQAFFQAGLQSAPHTALILPSLSLHDCAGTITRSPAFE